MKEPTTVDLLEVAKDKIEQGWVQCNYAENKDCDEVDVMSEDAICWCALGAVGYAAQSLMALHARMESAVKILEWAVFDIEEMKLDDQPTEFFSENIIANYNDAAGRTQKDIVELFEHAIKMAKSEKIWGDNISLNNALEELGYFTQMSSPGRKSIFKQVGLAQVLMKRNVTADECWKWLQERFNYEANTQ